MGDIFHFDSEHAKEYGIPEAVILHNLIYWIKKNKANNKHFYDGKYWTYNSVKAFNELFSFLSKDQVRRTLEKLEIKEAILTGNYNKLAYDRTTWYTLTDELYTKHIDNSHVAKMPNGSGEIAKSNWQVCQMEVAEVPNGNGKSAKPIPYINTNINTDNKTHTEEHEKFKILCVDLEKTLGEKIAEKKLQELINSKGADAVNQYLINWDKYRHHAKSTQASYFIYCVQNELPEPQAKTTNGRLPNYANYDQREYTEEEVEPFYISASNRYKPEEGVEAY